MSALRSAAPRSEKFVIPQPGTPAASARPVPMVTVVIIAYECRALLERCLRSVQVHGGVNGARPDVWVVDNASSDGTAAMLRASYPDVRLHAAGSNLGFARAANLALRRARSPYLLLLNPDAELRPGTVSRLVGLLEREPDAGMAGCRLVRPDGRLDHAARRSFPTIAGALGHMTRLGRRPSAPAALAQYRAPECAEGGPVDAINGAFMLIRREALDDVGLFDERFWLYTEDLDLCYRFKQRGWKVLYEPSVSALHVKAACSGTPRRPRQNYAFHYGMYRFYRKHYAPRRPHAVNAAVYGGIGMKLALSMARSALERRVRHRPR